MNKKIISFSLYGNNKKYVENAIINSQIYRKIYPGWKCYFYCHINVNMKYITKLIQNKCTVFIINETFDDENTAINHSQLWRFKPLDDDTVDVLICRDVDSILNTKEALAVEEWLKSNKKFHIMHDHFKHDGCVILAGMWGCKGKLFQTSYNGIINEYMKKYDLSKWKGIDQLFLRDVVWNLIKDDYIAHGHCEMVTKMYGLVTKDYPPPRKYINKYDFIMEHLHFIGQVNNMYWKFDL